MNARAGALPKTDIDALRAMLLQMAGEGRFAQAIEMVLELLQRTSMRLAALELKNLGAHKSEAVSSAQLEMFLKMLEQVTASTQTAAADHPADTDEQEEPSKPRPHGRGKLPENLPRKKVIVPVTGEDRICAHCAAEKQVIGHQVRESLELEPARLMVIEEHVEVCACKRCHADAVTAPAPERVIERGLPGPALLTDVIVNKSDLAQPLERQSRRYGQLGYRIPPSTLCDWFAAGCELVEPLTRRFFELILKSFVMQADGTGLRVLDRDHPAGARTGAIWVYLSMELPLCFFRFIKDSDEDGPVITLKEREGYVVVDADQKLNPLFAASDAKAIESGCNMHGRRYIHKALEAGDARATYGIDLYKKVYRIEAQARRDRLCPDDVKALRQEKSRPLMMQLGEWARAGALAEDPKSPLGKAFGYLVRQFTPLTRFLDDGRLPIDNGASERVIRDIAVGRRMWLFAGSDEGAKRLAIAYSITGSCRLCYVDPRAYWEDVLRKLGAGWPDSKLDELLPHIWARAHPEHVRPPPPD